jgi:predicted KAP-like P-loop ATPase
MAESTASYSLPSDAPKTVIKDDEFGLKRLVVALADRLTRSDTPVGFVLGVEGAWGSGKSTLANFLGEEIARRTTAHQIVRFDPWLIGDKGSFLAVLLG